VHARVQTFHVDEEHMPRLVEALDAASDALRRLPGFGGLLSMDGQRTGTRHQVTVITLWSAEGLAASADEAEEARRLIAESSDLGVTSHEHAVIRFVAGTVYE